MVKNSLVNAGDMGSIAGWEDPIGKETATHSSNLARKIPQTKEPGRGSPWGRKESDMTEPASPSHNSLF